jgi:hypothetical protein
MACRHEPVVTDDIEEILEVAHNPTVGVASRQIAENLAGDGTVVVVLVLEIGDDLVPNLVRPCDRLIAGGDHRGEGSILQIPILGPEIGEFRRLRRRFRTQF